MLIKFILVLVAVFGGPVLFFKLKNAAARSRVKHIMEQPFPENWAKVLQQEVRFYQHLDEADKKKFQQLMLRFVHTTNINGGGGVQLTDELITLTGASAVIPVFHLPGWPYDHLKEVVLVPDRVRNPADIHSKERSGILGMVNGYGSPDTMFLSAPSLKAGFNDERDSRNVGIHEFAHIIDETDGVINGIPAAYMTREQIPLWKKVVEQDMERIVERKVHTNPYAATNEAEFFAVLSEEYFENPHRLQKEHPQAFKLLKQVYK